MNNAVPLSTQVGGHPGVLSDASGSLVIKAAAPREIAFYQHLSTITQPTTYSPTEDAEISTPSSEALFVFKRYIPKFLGTLQVQGQMVDEELKAVASDGHKESIVIENITYPYLRPSVLDVKLGTVTHEPDATEEKKARMIASAKASTSYEFGIRLTGLKTWHPNTGEYVVTARDFGRTLLKHRLPEGMERFFPDSTATGTGAAGPTSNSTTTATESSTPIPSFSPSTHKSNLIRILRSLHIALAHLHSLLSAVDIRFIGASLLIVYESDPEALEKAWKDVDTGKVRGDGLAMEEVDEDGEGDDESEEWFGFGTNGRTSSQKVDRNDTSIDEEEEEDDDDEVDAEEQDQPTPPWSIRMIDFAHTRLVDGEGPDTGVLLGIRNFGELVRGRIRELGGEEEKGSVEGEKDTSLEGEKKELSVQAEKEESRDMSDSGVGMEEVQHGQNDEANQSIEL